MESCNNIVRKRGNQNCDAISQMDKTFLCSNNG